jgi:hypothetical protein
MIPSIEVFRLQFEWDFPHAFYTSGLHAPPTPYSSTTNIRGKYKVWKPHHILFPHPPVVSSFLDQNFLLKSFFYNTFSLCSSLGVRRVCSVINSTEHILTAQDCSCSVSWESRCPLWNAKFHYHTDKLPTLDITFSQTNRFLVLTIYLFTIRFNMIVPTMSRTLEEFFSFKFS